MPRSARLFLGSKTVRVSNYMRLNARSQTPRRLEHVHARKPDGRSEWVSGALLGALRLHWAFAPILPWQPKQNSSSWQLRQNMAPRWLTVGA